MVNRHKTRQNRTRLFAALAGLVAIGAIAFLTFNVSREIRLLGSARSDNVQWTLVQTQVEFMEFAQQVNRDPVDLAALRLEFDIFYSRVKTLREATVFEGLRANPTSASYLEQLDGFLDQAVLIVDAPDAQLLAQMPDLANLSASVTPTVRALGNSGLDLFA
ncbi:hypothetical protein [Pseudooctadecabacter sp.]|uniref:hypothetical protein n=1 Tax=Pseudooctadecabacter sp. TaxID=1966338 RepID=UPI0035C8527F